MNVRTVMLAALGFLLACGGGQDAEAEGDVPAAAHEVAAGGQGGRADTGPAGDGFEEILRSSDGRWHKGGWNHYGPGHFELDPETGVLTSRGGMGLFWYSARTYADFELELEFRVTDEHTNSGVFVRVPEVPSSDDYIHRSFEIQINDAGEGIHGTGAAYDAEPATRLASLPPGEWNRYRITFQGSRLQVELNGEQVLDWEAEPRGKIREFHPSGYIGLQNHDDRSPVYFRNVRVRELR
jgi:hypothetical protein